MIRATIRGIAVTAETRHALHTWPKIGVNSEQSTHHQQMRMTLSGLEVGTTSICNSLSITSCQLIRTFCVNQARYNPRENLVFLLDGQVKTRLTWEKNTQHHPRFCLDWNLDTDDFANMCLFIDEVSWSVPTAFENKNTLDNGIGIVRRLRVWF